MTKITILYDNYGFREGYRYGWGFSAYIEHDNRKILFDFGENWDAIEHNMKLSGISPEDIDIAILSHDHWDHNGGLKGFLSENEKAEVFLPAGFGGREIFDAPMWEDTLDGREVKIVNHSSEIGDGIYTSGALPSDIGLREQALGIETDRGILAIVGCSHPGVDTLIESLKRFGKVFGVMGGFHGFENIDYFEELELIVPTHCTKKREEILERYPEKAIKAGAGFRLDI
jgi:7,8-dihydropterin-6-yl-methyl-4-(beta-D-ribofuranosyl)aminobenzene 5'-phosphate synthase